MLTLATTAPTHSYFILFFDGSAFVIDIGVEVERTERSSRGRAPHDVD